MEEVHWWAAYLRSLVQLESLPEFACFSGLLALAFVLQTTEPCAYSFNWNRLLLGSGSLPELGTEAQRYSGQ